MPGGVLVSESREVMNVRQASQYLGISPDTLYRYITEGEIPAFKLGTVGNCVKRSWTAGWNAR